MSSEKFILLLNIKKILNYDGGILLSRHKNKRYAVRFKRSNEILWSNRIVANKRFTQFTNCFTLFDFEYGRELYHR